MNMKQIMSKILIVTLLVLSINSLASAIDTNKIVLYYGFEETPINTTTVFIDDVGGRNLIPQTVSTATNTSGKPNQALRMKGSYSANLTTLNLGNAHDGVSINFWYKVNSTTPNNIYPIVFEVKNKGILYNTYTYISSPTYTRIQFDYIQRTNLPAMNLNTWGMGTMVINQSNNMIAWYLNRDLESVSNFSTILDGTFNNTLEKFSMVAIGIHTNDLIIDELMIYNGTFTASDIALLYNNGFGISLSELISNTTLINQTGCLDESTYCSNLYLLGNSLHCDFNDATHCASGCDSISQVCNPQTCNNTCNVVGAKKCTTSTSIGTCQDTDGDGCFEYSSGEQCGVGFYCSPQGDFFAVCSDVSTFGLSNNSGFSIIPDYQNTDYTTYVIETSSRTLKATTSNAVHIQGFFTQALASTSTSRTCNYIETPIYTITAFGVITNQTTFTFNPLGTTGFVNIKFLPNDSVETNIRLNDMLSTNMNQLLFLRNTTAKSVKVYLLNGTEIYTDYSQNSYDDLSGIELTTIYNFLTGTYTNTILFDRVNDNKISTLPQYYAGTSVASIIINSSQAQLNSIDIKSYTEPQGFSQTLPDDKTYLQCLYDNDGSYLVRTYNNNNYQPDYTNYQDYRINVVLAVNTTSGGAPFDQDTQDFVDATFGTGLSVAQKLFYAIMITFVALILVVILGVYTDMPSALTGGLSVIVVIASLIMFAFLGFIPIWIIILLGIIGAGVVAMFFKGMVST